jgi:hypothetical protein
VLETYTVFGARVEGKAIKTFLFFSLTMHTCLRHALSSRSHAPHVRMSRK